MKRHFYLLFLMITTIFVAVKFNDRSEPQLKCSSRIAYPFPAQDHEPARFEHLSKKMGSDHSAASYQDLADLAASRFNLAMRSGDAEGIDESESLAKKSLLKYSNEQAKIVLIKVMQARHQFRKSLEEIEKLKHHHSYLTIKITSLIALGEFEKAKLLLQDYSGKTRVLNSNFYLLQALVYENQSRYSFAEESICRALEKEDLGGTRHSIRLRNIYARILIKTGRLEKAREVLLESVRMIPEQDFPFRLLAHISMLQEDYNEALVNWTKALQYRSENQLLYEVALTYEKLGKREKAEVLRAEVRKNFLTDLEKSEYGHMAGFIKLLLESKYPQDHSLALKLAKDEKEKRPHPYLVTLYAKAAFLNNQKLIAKREIEKALEMGPKDPFILIHAETILEVRKKNYYLEQAQKINPYCQRGSACGRIL